MTRVNCEVAISDRTRFGLHVGRGRIPAEIRGSVSQLHEIVEAANAIWSEAEHEAQALREQAYGEGFQAGFDEALARCAHTALQAQEEAQAFLRQSEARVARLAINALQRIVPDLAADDDVMARLVWKGVRSSYGQGHVNVRLHLDKVEPVRQRLDALLSEQGNRGEVRVSGDPQLSVEDVVVESDAGTVLVGLREQLDVMSQLLEDRAEQVDAQQRG